jgi:glutathione-regulated potassium-efflux system ancillary protein KefC
MVLLWIALAFVLGFGVRLIGLPPMIGFLAGGFVLHAMGQTENVDLLGRLADVGVTLLLFSIGLKLEVKSLLRPEVWGTTSLHMLIVVVLFGLGFWGLALTGTAMFAGLAPEHCLILAFALSFSSTVFAVKVLEDKGEMASRHGRIAIGILIVQDIAAVVFLAFSAGKIPSPWALILLGLIPLRPLLMWLMTRAGHGELLILFGLVLALIGAQGFELVQVKGDLGALILGVMMAGHPKASELSKALLGFKEMFLVAFFLKIGLAGMPDAAGLVIAVGLAAAVAFKTLLFLVVMTRFHLRARTSALASLALANYSEFGLIVGAIAAKNGWLSDRWLVVVAIALSLSFVLAAPLNSAAHSLYTRFRDRLKGLESAYLLHQDRPIEADNAEIAILGMGRVGSGAYDAMRERFGEVIIGVERDPVSVARHRAVGRRVIEGDATDADFWSKIPRDSKVHLVLLALSHPAESIEVAKRLRDIGFSGTVVASVKFADQEQALKEAGVDAVFNVYADAGVGLAERATATVAAG